jgi:anti-sigma-K factor RskA
MSHEGYKEMLPLYALGALEAEDARALEAHLAACAECRAELNEWRSTAAALAYAARTVEPSVRLRARILESVREQQPKSSSAGTVEGNGGGGGTVSRAPSNVVSITESPRRMSAPAWKFGAIAASLATVALLASVFVLLNRNSAMRSEIARLSTRLNQIQGELASERESKELIATRAEQDRQILMTANFTTLRGTEAAPGARAMLAYDPNTGRAMLLADNLPPAPAGKAYQLWYIAGNKPLPGTVFTPDARGHAEVRDQAPAEGRDATIFAVTLEPSSGVSAPTGDKYLLGATS